MGKRLVALECVQCARRQRFEVFCVFESGYLLKAAGFVVVLVCDVSGVDAEAEYPSLSVKGVAMLDFGGLKNHICQRRRGENERQRTRI